MVDMGPKHPDLNSNDVHGVSRINPQSGVGRYGTTLNVHNDIACEMTRHSGLCPTKCARGGSYISTE